MRRPPLHLAPSLSCATAALLIVLSLITKPATAQPIINEIMYAPVSPEPEWIEIYNPGSIAYDLAKWAISTVTKSTSFPACVLAPNEFLIVTKDSAALRLRRPSNYLIVELSLPALKNTGGFVVLRDSSQRMIDSLEYQPSWGGSSGTSLERKNAARPSTLASNWGTTKDTSGATPGRVNSIATPTFDLGLDSLSYSLVGDSLGVSVRVINDGSRSVANSTLTLASDSANVLRVIHTEPIDSLAPDSSRRMYLSITNPPLRGAQYWLFITSAADTSHSNDTLRFSSSAGSSPLSVLINEIMFAPVKPEPEWIELLNASTDSIDISGWFISVGHSAPQQIPDGVAPLAPDSMLVITSSDSVLAAVRHVSRQRIVRVPLPTLSNTGSTVTLRDGRSEVIDSVSYDGSWIKADGTSIERIDPLQPGDEATNWKACEDTSGTTILAPNSVRVREYDIALKGYTLTDSTIVLTITNEGRDTVRHTALTVNGYESVIYPITATLARNDSLHITVPLPRGFYGTDSLLACIQDSFDQDHSNDSLRLSIANDIPLDSLVINEIMYQPVTGSCEWVELYNTSSRTILMDGLRLFVGSKSFSQFVSPAFQIQPTSLGVIAANSTIFSLYPALATRSEVAVLGRSSLDLSNDSASIVLRNPDGSTIDSVRYFKTWQSKLRPDPTGISLERIHANGPSNDASNWQLSNDSSGATPLARNSATTTIPTPPTANVSFSTHFDPNPFSPDGDGFQDESVLTIQSGDDLQYAVRVRLFDARGRMVRTLADATTMTSSTSITFNGKNDNGQTMGTGLYTVLVELSGQNPPRILTKILGVAIAGRRR